MRIVIAPGGNALPRRSDPMTTEVRRRTIVMAELVSRAAPGPGPGRERR
jgi:hypothetical protein